MPTARRLLALVVAGAAVAGCAGGSTAGNGRPGSSAPRGAVAAAAPTQPSTTADASTPAQPETTQHTAMTAHTSTADASSTAPRATTSAAGSAPAGPSTGAASAPSSPAGSAPCGWQPAAPARYDHVVWVWFENKNASALRDAATAPFFHELAGTCGSAAAFVDHGVHPSLPNYIAATTGATQGITDDQPPAAHPLAVDNLFRQVRAAGGSARTYAEAMTRPCQLTTTGRYAVRHNPATYFTGGDDRAACQRDDVPFTQFATDLAAGQLPSFALVVPDTCNDMHDCPVSTGDAWLQRFLTTLTSDAAYRKGSTVVLVAFDESEGAGSTPFYVVAPSVVPGAHPTSQLDHFSMLAFTEEVLGIDVRLGGAAGAPDLRAAFGI